MGTILDKIISDKREEVKLAREKVSFERVREMAAGADRCRNFYKAVTKNNLRGLNVIAEVKKASPSAGVICEDFDPVVIAKIYESCGADAISCLTDEKYFQGKLDYIGMIKEAVGLPILRKDFIIDKYQLYEARAAGADAVLLIAEALEAGELMDFLILSNQLTMTSIIEVHGADKLMQVRSMLGFPQEHYSVIGVNNRNLKTMEVDINNTCRLAELVENRKELVAESGIKSREDVSRLVHAGVGAVLIGETLCGSGDIRVKFSELFDGDLY